MLFIATLILLYFIIPAVIGYVKNVTCSSRKRIWYSKRAAQIRRWKPITYATIFFTITTFLFFVVSFLMLSGVTHSKKFYFMVLAINCLAALAFLYFYLGIAKLWEKYKEALKAFFVPLTIAVATLSKIYSDSGIAELSGLNPQDLPSSQLFLTFILVPVIWLIAFSLTMGYASMPLMLFLLLKSIIYDFRQKDIKKVSLSDGNVPDIIAIAAIALFAIFSLSIMQKIVSKSVYEPRLRQAIAFSSFHLPTTFCGLPEVKNVYVAPMSDNRAALAIPDGRKAYKFVPISCKPDGKSEEETNKIIDEIIRQNQANLLNKKVSPEKKDETKN